MNLLASSGDEGRRDDGRSLERPMHEGRGHYVHGGAQGHYYGDAERYGRSRTADNSRRSMSRYGRDQYDRSPSRDVPRDERDYQPRIAVVDRRYADDRYMVHNRNIPLDRRMTLPRDNSRDASHHDELRQRRYDQDRQIDDVYQRGYGYQGYPSYQTQRYGYDYQPYDRYGQGHGYDRYGYDGCYTVDRSRSHYEDRMVQDRLVDQPGRVRFDNKRLSRSNDRRRSSSIERDNLPRRESRNTEDMKRAKSLPPRQLEEVHYQRGFRQEPEKVFEELSKKSSMLREERRRESQARQTSLSRRESERDSQSKREFEKSETKVEFEDQEKDQQPLYRRESESHQHASSRRESEARQQQLSRRESEDRQQFMSRRESEGRQESLSRRESEGRQQIFSRRESEDRPECLSRRELEGRQESLSRRESEGRTQVLSRRESKGRQESFSRRESEGRQESLSRRESEGRQQVLSRRESEGRQESLSRRESEGKQQVLSRRESEGRQESLSRRESEGGQRSLSRSESEGRQEYLPMRDSEIRQQSLSGRDSENSEHVLPRRDSEALEKSLSRRESDIQGQLLSGGEYESGPTSRRQSEERQQSLSRYRSDEDEKLPSRRESEHERSRRSSSGKEDHLSSRKSSATEELPLNVEMQENNLVVLTGSRSRSQSRSQQGSERSDGELEIQSDGVEYADKQGKQRQARRTVQFGTQLVSERMAAPIPPYSEPRSTYPVSKAHTGKDDDRSSVRSRELAVRATYDIMRRRYYERSVDPSLNPTWLERGGTADSTYNMSQVSEDVLRIQEIDFCCKENAKTHKTLDYELVKDAEKPNPVFRRGENFFMDITFKNRAFEHSRDNVYLNFYFGPNPSVPKHTRIVLPIGKNSEFQRVPYQWDSRFITQVKNTVSVEISMPVSCPVGMWRCVVETSAKEDNSSRLQYRCAEDMYVIFNPFAKDDGVYMGDEAQRQEFVMNDSGKIYTGGYRNVRGRPWIYGQFDDCMLPAACVLLEMSGLSHAERGNAVKVTKALSSMIKSSRFGQEGTFESGSTGLIEAKYEDSYCGGNSPHLWSGSVQIIEEFLRLGATPVKYGQCWVMTGLMTSLCRALGLPARPVTAFVSAVGTRDTLTVDRFVDRFGDIQEDGPSFDQNDALWSFRTWCDVWMHRADLIPEYSGWQATDPCRTFRDEKCVVKGSCGPCPVEALRRGDVGQRDDVDAFFSSMNAYVRYFYEDEESGWGYSPFRQFKYPVSRYVLTKTVGKFDDKGDDDCEDLTSTYRDDEKTEEEKYKTFNSCRGLRNLPPFEYQAAAHSWVDFDPNETDDQKFDVKFELETPERVMIGQAFTIPVIVTNNSTEPRTMQTNICTRSSFYTGSLASYLKRSSTQLTLDPQQSQTINLTLDPLDYEDKLLGMAYVKVTVTGFVQETGQSFIDEFDFRFNKPWLKIETAYMKVGEETEADFSFTNPLDVPLTDCFLTMEISGSVRPRTIRINRDVRPHESFTLSHSFLARSAGERHLVACFASQQLSDVVGHRAVVVHE